MHVIYSRLSRCMCSQGGFGVLILGSHKGGKAVSRSVRYWDTLSDIGNKECSFLILYYPEGIQIVDSETYQPYSPCRHPG